MRSTGRIMFAMLDRLKQWAVTLKRDAYALCLAARDPRVPWYGKFIAAGVAAYALSPVDLIPDFIPVLGYIDDLIIVPAGIMLAVCTVPPHVMAEHRAAAAAAIIAKPVSRAGLLIVLMLWMVLAAVAGWVIYRHFLY